MFAGRKPHDALGSRLAVDRPAQLRLVGDVDRFQQYRRSDGILRLQSHACIAAALCRRREIGDPIALLRLAGKFGDPYDIVLSPFQIIDIELRLGDRLRTDTLDLRSKQEMR